MSAGCCQRGGADLGAAATGPLGEVKEWLWSEDAVLVRDVKLEGGRQRHPSGGASAKEMVIGLEGVELGADGKVRTQTGIKTSGILKLC